jgi:hypothetical protein
LRKGGVFVEPVRLNQSQARGARVAKMPNSEKRSFFLLFFVGLGE